MNYRGGIIKKGVKLWYVGADTAKDLLFQRFGGFGPAQAEVDHVHLFFDAVFERVDQLAHLAARE